MADPITIGAGVGAIGAAATGNNPLKGALLGAGLGSGYGGIQSLLQGGSFMSGALPSLSSAAGGTGIKLAPAIAGDTSLALSPVLAGGAGGAAGAAGAGVGAGALTGAGINLAPMAAYDGFNILPTAASKMGITDLASYATGSGTDLTQPLSYYEQLKAMLPEMNSQNVANVIGGAKVAQQYSQQPRLIAPAGGMTRGNPPDAEAIQKLIAQIKPQERKRISLLVG